MNWFQRLFLRGMMEDQLDKELRFHLEQHTADLIARGVDPREARRQANLALGGPDQVKEQCRDARGTRWLEDLVRDVHYAVRSLRQRPGFAAVALLTLALGTGATTVMFTVVNGVLLKPLPFPDADRLVGLLEKTEQPTRYGNIWSFTYPNYLDCKHECRSLTMAAWRYRGGTVSTASQAEYVDGWAVSSDLFRVLGITPSPGRAFIPEEDRIGASPVIILSQSLWQRLYAASPAAIGSTLVFEGTPCTVVGVAPARLRLGEGTGDSNVFTLLGQDPEPRLQSRQAHGINVWARLEPGATLAEARSELQITGSRLAEQYPESNSGRTFLADTLRPDVRDVRSTLWLLLGAVSLVLLIACVNVASLLLARAVSRERELALRVALGAGRGRLVRQCLTESSVLGILGGLLGVLIAAAGISPFVAFWPRGLPRADQVHLDWRVFLFAIVVALLSGLLFGLAPALRVPARDLEQTLRAGARTLAGGSRRLHAAFIVSEVAVAVVLLVSAGMLGRTMLRLSTLDSGISTRNLLITRMALSPATLSNPAQIRAAWQDILERARRVPAVESVATVDTVPMRRGYNELGYWTSPDLPPEKDQPAALATSVSPDYLKVMGIPLREGRFFDDQDRPGSKPVIVIDDVMAQQAFRGEDPVGKRLWMPSTGRDPLEVVGVVGHVRHWGPAIDDTAQVRAQFYYPFAQVPDRLQRLWSELTSIAVRTNIDPLNVVEPLRRELRGSAGDQVLYQVTTMEQLASDSLARQRFLLLLFGIFSGIALLLASIGIYGVLAYLTSQRVPEIGIRMALGASAAKVVRLVLGQSLGMITLGVALGIAASLAAGRLLERSVDGMQPTEAATLAIMISVLVVAALLASLVPAFRASRIDPTGALRQE